MEIALPPSVPRVKASKYVAEIAATWNAMSSEEKQEASQEALDQLKMARENKRFNRHGFAINAMRDASTTLDAIEREVRVILLV